MAATKNQEVVQRFPAGGSHPALGKSIRPWRAAKRERMPPYRSFDGLTSKLCGDGNP